MYTLEKSSSFASQIRIVIRSSHLAQRRVACITTTTGKQRNVLGREEIRSKHTITEAGAFFEISSFPKSPTLTDRSTAVRFPTLLSINGADEVYQISQVTCVDVNLTSVQCYTIL